MWDVQPTKAHESEESLKKTWALQVLHRAGLALVRGGLRPGVEGARLRAALGVLFEISHACASLVTRRSARSNYA